MLRSNENKTAKSAIEYVQELPAIYVSLGVLFILVLIFYIGNPNFLSVYNMKAIGNATAILLLSDFNAHTSFTSYSQ